MTLEQFRGIALDGMVVECLNAQERRNTLELFKELGFEISAVSNEHLLVPAEEDNNTTYMHPGFNPENKYVCCYRDFERAKSDMRHAVSYDDIQDLIETPPYLLDERSDEEFTNDLMLLLN